MLKKLMSVAAIALAGITTACEEGPATLATGWKSPALWSSMVYASSNGPIYVEILGSPFGEANPRDFQDGVTQPMDNQILGRPSTFTALMAQAPQPHLRVILAFNPPKSLSSKQLCENRAGVMEPFDGEKVRVMAVFCNAIDREALHTVTGWAKADSLDHPRFKQLMGQVVRDLFGSQP